jgi:hypothetical protein
MPDLLCRRRPSSVAEWSDLAVPDAVSTLVTNDDAQTFDMATDRQRSPARVSRRAARGSDPLLHDWNLRQMMAAAPDREVQYRRSRNVPTSVKPRSVRRFGCRESAAP